MKYRTFRNIRLIVILAFSVGMIFGLRSCMGCGEQPALVEHYPANWGNPPAVARQQLQSMPVAGEAIMQITDADRAILSYKDSPLVKNLDDSGENYKKFVKTAGFNLDLRCDFGKGFAAWNRIKVDWDKDKKWDEKWSFNDKGEVKRQISPNDDGNYEFIYILQGNQWIRT